MNTFRIISTPTQFLIVTGKDVMLYMTTQNEVYPHVFFSESDALDYLQKYIDNSHVFDANNSCRYIPD